MALGKQAKPLTKYQIDAVVSYLANTRHPTRNRLIFLLSIRAGPSRPRDRFVNLEHGHRCGGQSWPRHSIAK